MKSRSFRRATPWSWTSGPNGAVPCKAIAPVVDELAEEYDGRVTFAKVDVDSNPATPQKFGIRGIPALLIFKDGDKVGQLVGAAPKAKLVQSIEAAMAG